MLKSWWMCRFVPPPGQHHFGSPHGRYLQIFAIIDFSNKHAQSWNCKILMDVSNFAASGTASFPVPAWPVPSDFWNSMIFQKNCKKLKVWDPDGCVELCRLREGIILGPRMAGPSDLLKFIDFSKNHLFCDDFCNYIDVNIGGAAQTSWPYTP